MNKTKLEVRLGIFFLLILLVGVLMMELIGGLEPLKSGVLVQTKFKNVMDLKKGDPVKVAGVNVGNVSSIKLKEGGVLVSMKIGKNTGITTESVATIKFLGMMGQNYVSIDFADGGEPVQDGAMLLSQEQQDLSMLMTKLDGVIDGIDELTRNFSSDSLTSMMSPFTDFIKENQDSLSSIGPILVNMENITKAISEGKGSIGKMMMEGEMYGTAMTTLTNLEVAIGDARSIASQTKWLVTDIQQGRGSVGKLLTDDAVYVEMRDSLTQLKEIMQKVNTGEGTAGRIVNDASLYKNAKLTMQKLDKATEGLEDQGPISVIGIAAGSLF
ncbi:MAG: MCE family protein [Clostridia bacterium]|nr:MCE family protein [Clostridia bacterium]